MVFIDHDEGRVGAAFGVEEDLRRPGLAIVGGATDGHLRAGLFVVGI